MTAYEDLHRAVLAAVVHEDPMDLTDPGNDLAGEYDAEAREIARRLVHAGGTSDAAVVASSTVQAFAEAFGERLPLRRIARIAAALELGETGIGDLSARLGDADVVAAFVRALVAAFGRRAVVTIETDDRGRNSVLVAAPPGEDEGTEPLSIELLGAGDGEIRVRHHLIELGAGDLGPHQPLRDPVSAIEGLTIAVVAGSVCWSSVHRRGDARNACPVSEWIRFVVPQGPFEIETHLGVGGWGRIRRTEGQAAAYPLIGGVDAIEDDPDTTVEELWGSWLDFSGLVVRDDAVRIPVRRSVQRRGWTTAEARPDRMLVIEGAAAVEVTDVGCDPWDLPFDGLWWERGDDPAVRIEGEPGVTVRVRGTTDRLRVQIQPLVAAEDEDRPAPSVTLLGSDGRTRMFSDIDAARRELGDERALGAHRGHDADGFLVTVTLTDVSGPLRRRARLRRWMGPRIQATSTTTAEQVGATLAADARRDEASE